MSLQVAGRTSEVGDYFDNLFDFCRNTDILIHDGQYTADELETKYRGWGHSSVDQAMELAKKCGCGSLILTHHDPAHDDHFLDELSDYCKMVFPKTTLAYDRYETQIENTEIVKTFFTEDSLKKA